jgi:hypothetical protein
LSGAFDNKGVIAESSWVEYDVTPLVTADGTYTFALVADSSDGVVFSSREGTTPPQLVVMLGAAGSTSTPTATATNTPTPTASATPTQTTIASTFTFTPIIDSYVHANNPSKNYGTSITLRADASPTVRSYLRFIVEGVSGNVTRATLLIYADSGSSAGITAHSVSNSDIWSELTISYNNAPPVGAALGSSGAFAAASIVRIDVTSYITGNAVYNFGITTPGNTAVSLASSEAAANVPQLIIETTP